MLAFRLACLSLAAVSGAAFAQSARTSQHIDAVETGLGPAVIITERGREHRDIRAEMQRLHIPAVSVAIIHNGELEWAKGYGNQSDGGAPVTVNTLFQAASISKSLTAMAALKLVQQQKLSLDSPIQTELRSWTLPETSLTLQHPVTLRELLSHTAGISVHGFDGYAAGKPVPNLRQVLSGTTPANSPPIVVEAVPGEKFSYSGGGYTIVQQIMIDQTGKPFASIMKSLVLDPLKMKSSSFEQPVGSKSRKAVAMPADDRGKPIPGGPYTYPELAPAGLWTTPSDLARWVIEMQRSLMGRANHVLSPETTRTMLTAIRHGYGLGVEVHTASGKAAFSHTGSNEGYQCIYFAYENGDGAIIMTNGDNGSSLFAELLSSIAQEYGWPDYIPEQRTLVSVPLGDLAQFAGRFKINHGPPIEIKLDTTSLQLLIPGYPSRELLTSSSHSFFLTDTTMQLNFDGPDRGTVIFGGKDTFERVKEEH